MVLENMNKGSCMKRLFMLLMLSFISLQAGEPVVEGRLVVEGSAEGSVHEPTEEERARDEEERDRDVATTVAEKNGSMQEGQVENDSSSTSPSTSVVDAEGQGSSGGVVMEAPDADASEAVDKEQQEDADKGEEGARDVLADSSMFEGGDKNVEKEPVADAVEQQSQSFVQWVGNVFDALMFKAKSLFNKLTGRTAAAEEKLQDIFENRPKQKAEGYEEIVEAARKAGESLEALDKLSSFSDEGVQQRAELLTQQVVTHLADLVVAAERYRAEGVIDSVAEFDHKKAGINREVQLVLRSLDPQVAADVMSLAHDTLSGMVPEENASAQEYQRLKQRSMDYHDMVRSGVERYQQADSVGVIADIGRQPLMNARQVLVEFTSAGKQASGEAALDSLRSAVDAASEYMSTDTEKAVNSMIQEAAGELSGNASRYKYQTVDIRKAVLKESALKVKNVGTAVRAALDIVEKNSTPAEKAQARGPVDRVVQSAENAETLFEGSKKLVESSFDQFMEKLDALGDAASRGRGIQEFLAGELGVEVADLQMSDVLEKLHDRLYYAREKLALDPANAEQVKLLDNAMQGMRSLNPLLVTPYEFNLLTTSSYKPGLLLATQAAMVGKTMQRLYVELQTAPVVKPEAPAKAQLDSYKQQLAEYQQKIARGLRATEPVDPQEVYQGRLKKYHEFMKESRRAAKKAQAEAEYVDPAEAEENAYAGVRSLFGEAGEQGDSLSAEEDAFAGLRSLFGEPEEEFADTASAKDVVQSGSAVGGIDGLEEAATASSTAPVTRPSLPEGLRRQIQEQGGEKDAVPAEKAPERRALPSDLQAQIQSAGSSVGSSTGVAPEVQRAVDSIQKKLKAGLPKEIIERQLESGGIGGSGEKFTSEQIEEAFKIVNDNAEKKAAAEKRAEFDKSRFEAMKESGVSDVVIRSAMKEAGATQAEIDSVLSASEASAEGTGSLFDQINRQRQSMGVGEASKPLKDYSLSEQVSRFDAMKTKSEKMKAFRDGYSDVASRVRLFEKLSDADKQMIIDSLSADELRAVAARVKKSLQSWIKKNISNPNMRAVLRSANARDAEWPGEEEESDNEEDEDDDDW